MRRTLALFLLAIAPSACAGGPPESADPTLSGTWYLDLDGARARAVITWDTAGHVLSGEITDEDSGSTESIEHGTWDAASGTLEMQTGAQWIRGRVVEDILVGRFADF